MAKNVGIGQDAQVGCIEFIHFPSDLIQNLTDYGLIHLHHIQKLCTFSHLNKSWFPAVEFELYVRESHIWDRYIKIMLNSNVHLSNNPNILLWVKNDKGGTYSPKLGYLVLRKEEEVPAPDWWCRSFWKLTYPLEINIFFRLVLYGKALYGMF